MLLWYLMCFAFPNIIITALAPASVTHIWTSRFRYKLGCHSGEVSPTNVEKMQNVFLFPSHLTLAVAWLWIHLCSPGLWWDWKLFVFIICAQKHLFTVTSAASEHLKSQSKQSNHNSCCLDISSLLTKLEKQKSVYHQSCRIMIVTE